MREAEAAIRTLVDTWLAGLAASRGGDLATVLDLIADDVVFLTPGRATFGEAAFAAASRERRGHRIEGAGARSWSSKSRAAGRGCGAISA